MRRSVVKPAGLGSGAPNPKKGDVTLVYVEDILAFPDRDANGVLMLGNIVLKPNGKMIELYETPTSQKASHTIEGDEDMEAFMKKFEGSHPGDSLEVNEFVQNTISKGVIIIYGTACGSNTKKVLGSPCNPMKLKGEFTDDKDGVKHTLNFEQYQSDGQVAGFYTGTLQYAENFEVVDATAVAMTAENGEVYQLPSTAVVAEIDVTTMSLAHGKVVTLIGGGGAADSTLDAGAGTVATVILKNGTQWVALKDSVINLQVFEAGAVKYLIEVSRKAS